MRKGIILMISAMMIFASCLIMVNNENVTAITYSPYIINEPFSNDLTGDGENWHSYNSVSTTTVDGYYYHTTTPTYSSGGAVLNRDEGYYLSTTFTFEEQPAADTTIYASFAVYHTLNTGTNTAKYFFLDGTNFGLYTKITTNASNFLIGDGTAGGTALTLPAKFGEWQEVQIKIHHDSVTVAVKNSGSPGNWVSQTIAYTISVASATALSFAISDYSQWFKMDSLKLAYTPYSGSLWIPAEPTIAINSPSNGVQYYETMTNSFVTYITTTGTMTNVTLKVDNTEIAWSANSYNNFTVMINALALGSHTLSCFATDDYSRTVNTSITFEIMSLAPPPEIAITSPVNGATIYNTSNTIDVVVQITFGDTIVNKTLSIDGSVVAYNTNDGGAVTFVITNNLSLGVHNITAYVIDVSGQNASTTISITIIEHNAPVIVITSPTDGTSILNTTNTFNVVVTITSDIGILNVTISIDGVLYAFNNSGATPITFVVTNNLALGDHDIVAYVEDEYNRNSTDAISIMISVLVIEPDNPGSGISGTVVLLLMLAVCMPLIGLLIRRWKGEK